MGNQRINLIDVTESSKRVLKGEAIQKTDIANIINAHEYYLNALSKNLQNKTLTTIKSGVDYVIDEYLSGYLSNSLKNNETSFSEIFVKELLESKKPLKELLTNPNNILQGSLKMDTEKSISAINNIIIGKIKNDIIDNIEEYLQKLDKEKLQILVEKIKTIDYLDEEFKEKLTSIVNNCLLGLITIKKNRVLEKRETTTEEVLKSLRELTKISIIGAMSSITSTENDFRENGERINGMTMIDVDADEISYGKIEDFNGMPAYVAKKNGKEFIVVGNGQYSKGYKNVLAPVNHNGNLIFQANNDGDWFLVSGNKEYTDKHLRVSRPIEINGELTYKIDDRGDPNYSGRSKIIVGDKVCYKSIPNSYTSDPTEFKGKPAFFVRHNRRNYLMIGDELYGSFENDINMYKLIEFEGNPVFIMKQDGKWIVMKGNQKYSESYDEISNLKNIGGKITYSAKKNGKWKVMKGNEQFNDEFDEIGEIVNHEGEPAFPAQKNGKWTIIMGNKNYPYEFDRIGGVNVVGKKLVFTAKKDGKYYIVQCENID